MKNRWNSSDHQFERFNGSAMCGAELTKLITSHSQPGQILEKIQRYSIRIYVHQVYQVWAGHLSHGQNETKENRLEQNRQQNNGADNDNETHGRNETLHWKTIKLSLSVNLLVFTFSTVDSLVVFVLPFDDCCCCSIWFKWNRDQKAPRAIFRLLYLFGGSCLSLFWPIAKVKH